MHGQISMAAGIANGLSAQNPDIIVALTTPPTQAVAKTARCPIVFVSVVDPIGIGVVKTLKGKGTGLCIAGKGAANEYLKTGDLYIYYSNDEKGNPTFPRIAIHAKGDQIAEMRGIAHKQNLDPYMSEVASAELAEFGNGEQYEGKSQDMKKLTEIENKTRQG